MIQVHTMWYCHLTEPLCSNTISDIAEDPSVWLQRKDPKTVTVSSLVDVIGFERHEPGTKGCEI